MAKVSERLDKRIAKAQDEDAASIERVKADYAAYIEQADQKAEKMNQQARGRQENDYKNAVEAVKEANDVKSYEQALKQVIAVGGYKDSPALLVFFICFEEASFKRLGTSCHEFCHESERLSTSLKKVANIFASASCFCFSFVLA